MEIAVLGCGPAGLIAAHTAREIGHQVRIISRRVKSEMPGAQYLHAPIEGVSPAKPKSSIWVTKTGDRWGYAEKVYGDKNAPVSFDQYDEGPVEAWDLQTTYGELWRMYSPGIIDTAVEAGNVQQLAEVYPLVISTIPAPALCMSAGKDWHEKRCDFHGQEVWFLHRAVGGIKQNEIRYNGEAAVPWYRSSSIFGHDSTEFAKKPAFFKTNFTRGFKPTKMTCTCQPSNVVRVGRFGKWDKSVLLHHVPGQVTDALQRMQ